MQYIGVSIKHVLVKPSRAYRKRRHSEVEDIRNVRPFPITSIPNLFTSLFVDSLVTILTLVEEIPNHSRQNIRSSRVPSSTTRVVDYILINSKLAQEDTLAMQLSIDHSYSNIGARLQESLVYSLG